MGKKDREDNIENEPKPHYDFGGHVQIASFLGGITIAAMVVLMQSEDSFNFEPWSTLIYYPEFLIAFLGGIGTIFLVSLLGLVDPALGYSKPTDRQIHFCENLMALGYILLIGVIPFLILPFSVIGAIIIGILAIVLLGKVRSMILAE